MTFFYDLNKKLDEIRATPSTTHGQLNERDMGKHNNATTGFKALAKKAGGGEKGEKIAGAQFQKMKKAGQIEEEGMSRAAKGYEKYGKQGMQALAKAGREGKALDPVRNKYDKYDNDVDEGLGDVVKKVGGAIKKVGGAVLNRLGHGDDADMIRDLQKKMNMPQTGKKPEQVKEKMSPAKQKSFAALAPPTDKITFADKIAGAKKEVDEMLGDVAAEAMKSALSGGQKNLDKNNNGKLDAMDFEMLRKGAKQKTDEEEDLNPFTNYKKPRADKPRTGEVTHGAKHDTEHTATGRKVTRRVDGQGNSVGSETDDEGNTIDKRGRGRPKKSDGPRQERVTAKSRKTDRTAYQKKTNEGDLELDSGEYDQEGDMAKDSIKTVVRHAQALEKILGDNDNLPEWVQSKLAKIEGMMTAVDDYMQNQEDDEMAMGEEKTPTRDNRAERAGRKVTKDIEYDEKKKDGIHGTKRGAEDSKAERAGKKVAKDIEYDEKKDKPKKVKEQGGTDTPTASSGFSYGKGIYDSMNHELETMISESMNISMSMNTDANGGPSKSITVTATDDDAMKLSQMLKSAGLGGNDQGYGGSGYKPACGCGTPDCSCGDQQMDEVSMNEPDYPTNTETAQDSFEYSGGLNGPKSTGQTTVPVIAGQDDRMGEDTLRRLREMAGLSAIVVEEVEEIDESHCSDCDCNPCECDESVEESIARLREMSGIREAKKPDFPDIDNDGDKKETIEKALDDKKAAGNKKVAESLMAELQRFKKA
jgi:hypothetical protein